MGSASHEIPGGENLAIESASCRSPVPVRLVKSNGQSRAFVDHPNIFPSLPISAVSPPWVGAKVTSHDRYVTRSQWRISRRHGVVRRHLVDDRPAAGIPGPGMSISSIKYGNASVEGQHTPVRAEQCGSVQRD
jgi:hypothetical protein